MVWPSQGAHNGRMSEMSSKIRLRWGTAIVAAVALIGGTIAVTTNAVADTPLPTLTAQELLTKVASAKVDGMSGTVEQTSNLGLPALPNLAGMGGGQDLSSALALLTGTHTFRVWTSGTDKARLALVDGTTETDLIVNGTSVWMWSSADQKAVHRVLDADAKPSATPLPADVPQTPAAMVKEVLAKVGPTTDVTTSGTGTVAGRSVYQLVITPKDAATLVRDVRVSVDSETFVPLAVSITGTSPDPAISVAFTDVSFAVPDASLFSFTPPPGAKVTEATKDATVPETKPVAASERPKVVGEGWTTVVVAKLPTQTGDVTDGKTTDETTASAGQIGMLLRSLPTVTGEWGTGHLLKTTLLNIIITTDGRVAVGSVELPVLYQALS